VGGEKGDERKVWQERGRGEEAGERMRIGLCGRNGGGGGCRRMGKSPLELRRGSSDYSVGHKKKSTSASRTGQLRISMLTVDNI